MFCGNINETLSDFRLRKANRFKYLLSYCKKIIFTTRFHVETNHTHAECDTVTYDIWSQFRYHVFLRQWMCRKPHYGFLDSPSCYISSAGYGYVNVARRRRMTSCIMCITVSNDHTGRPGSPCDFAVYNVRRGTVTNGHSHRSSARLSTCPTQIIDED